MTPVEQDLRASEGAFVALRSDGKAVAWGSAHCGAPAEGLGFGAWGVGCLTL